MVANEPIEIAADQQCRPRLGRGAIAGVDEIAGLQPAPARFARMRNTGLERAAPKVDVRLELLMDLGAELDVIEALVDVERQHTPLIRCLVVSSEGANRDGVRDKPVGGI